METAFAWRTQAVAVTAGSLGDCTDWALEADELPVLAGSMEVHSDQPAGDCLKTCMRYLVGRGPLVDARKSAEAKAVGYYQKNDR